MIRTPEEDPLWEAVVTLLLEAGSGVDERQSRYGDEPALYQEGREIAHLEAPGHMDLRITRGAWRQLRGRFCHDPAIHADPDRRDWIRLALTSDSDVERLRDLLEAAALANH